MSEQQAAPEAAPEKPAEAEPAKVEAPDPDDPDKAAPTPAPEPEPKPDLASEVMKRRDASQLARLVQEKRQLEAERSRLKEYEPKLQTLTEVERLLDDGDHAGAVEALLKAKYGDKAAEALTPLYEGLTSRILGVESKSTVPPKVERDIARLQSELESLKQEKAMAQAAAEEMAQQAAEVRVQQTIENLGTYLNSSPDDYPYLLAEADDPGGVVWEILLESSQRGQEIEPEEAAKLANEYFKPAFDRKKDKYQRLLAPKGATTPSKPETRNSQVVSRKSLTNADASQVPPDSEPPKPRNDAERVERSFALLRKGLTGQ